MATKYHQRPLCVIANGLISHGRYTPSIRSPLPAVAPWRAPHMPFTAEEWEDLVRFGIASEDAVTQDVAVPSPRWIHAQALSHTRMKTRPLMHAGIGVFECHRMDVHRNRQECFRAMLMCIGTVCTRFAHPYQYSFCVEILLTTSF